MRPVRRHLTYSNVVATLALFIVLTGGTAVALTGSNSVQSDDLGPGAQVKAPDVADNAVNSADVVNESLTGADIKNRSGVLTCTAPSTARYGRICAGSDGGARDYFAALDYCADFGGLRVPTVSEATTLGRKYDVPGVTGNQAFWTDSVYVNGQEFEALAVTEGGTTLTETLGTSHQTVCVTDPGA